MSIETDETMEEIEQRFGSNKAALSDYLQRRRAAGFPDHRSASSVNAYERKLTEAAVNELVKARAEGRKPNLRGARAAAERNLTAAATTQPAKPVAVKPAPKPAILTAEEQEAARRKARHDAVMASPHAKGRAATAASLLGGAPDLSADQCIAALATMPTDAEAMASIRRQKADDVWARVHGVEGSGLPKPAPTERQAAADAVWDRAHAKMAARKEFRV